MQLLLVNAGRPDQVGRRQHNPILLSVVARAARRDQIGKGNIFKPAAGGPAPGFAQNRTSILTSFFVTKKGVCLAYFSVKIALVAFLTSRGIGKNGPFCCKNSPSFRFFWD